LSSLIFGIVNLADTRAAAAAAWGFIKEFRKTHQNCKEGT